MALAKDRDTKARYGHDYTSGVAATKKIYAGALVCLNAGGFLTPGATALDLIALGRAKAPADNSAGADGDISVGVERGIFRYDNSADADEITLADVNELCYVVDDATVAKTDAGGTRSVAGRIFDVDDQGVWVDFRAGAANDVVPGKAYLTMQATDLVAADAAVYHCVAPISGDITKIWSVLEGHALATGDTTLTGKIGATAITNGVITITQAGSAIGDVDSAVPTAARAVVAGQVISFTVGGANTNNAATSRLVVEITP